MKDEKLESLLDEISKEPIQEDITVLEHELFNTLEHYRTSNPKLYYLYACKYAEMYREKIKNEFKN